MTSGNKVKAKVGGSQDIHHDPWLLDSQCSPKNYEYLLLKFTLIIIKLLTVVFIIK